MDPRVPGLRFIRWAGMERRMCDLPEEEQAEYELWREAAAASARRAVRVPRETEPPLPELPVSEPAPA